MSLISRVSFLSKSSFWLHVPAELGRSAFLQCVQLVLPAGTEPRKLEAKCVCVPAVSWLFPAGEGSAHDTRNLWLAEAKWLKVLLRDCFSVFVLLHSPAHLCQTWCSRSAGCVVAGRLRLKKSWEQPHRTILVCKRCFPVERFQKAEVTSCRASCACV